MNTTDKDTHDDPLLRQLASLPLETIDPKLAQDVGRSARIAFLESAAEQDTVSARIARLFGARLVPALLLASVSVYTLHSILLMARIYTHG